MGDEMCDDKDIEEITQLISELTIMRREIKHSTIIDSNKILKLYGLHNNSEIDSGIESEPLGHQTETNESNFILPACNLQEIVFESNDFDEVLKNLFKYVWQCLQRSIGDIEKNRNKTETIIECIKDFTVFLSDSKNDYFRETVVKKNLDVLFAKGMERHSEEVFNFVMEVLIKLSSAKELGCCIFNLIIEKIKIFAVKVNTVKADGSFLFKYETDFSRINTLMLTALVLQKDNQNEFIVEAENKYDINYILETFMKHPDFYILEFLGRKLFLPE